MNLYDPQAEALAKHQARLAREAEIARTQVIRQLMASPEGRAWVHDRLILCFHTPFQSDPYLTAFNCGKQNEALALFAEVTASAPEMYLQMMKEQVDGRRTPVDSNSDTSDGDTVS